MRVMHVGWGFTPWRPGGLILYAEDLMGSQVERGYEVAYFCSGRHYPFMSKPRLKRWRRDGVAIHEVINPPIVAALESGTRRPDLDVHEPWMEAAFQKVIDRASPDLIHIQELHGLPSSLIDVAAGSETPVVMTLHDYGPLCATLRLFDADGRICTRDEVGADCVVRNATAPPDNRVLTRETVNYEIARARRALHLGRVDFSAIGPMVGRVYRRAGIRDDQVRAAISPTPEPDPSLALAFQHRRDVNVERLGRVDRLIAQSHRVGEVYRDRGVSGDHMRVLPGIAKHIELLRPRSIDAAPLRLTFATVNGCASPSKGSEVVTEALTVLRDRGVEGRFRFLVLGHVEPRAREFLAEYDGAELHGAFGREELDSLLQPVDVGLMPSMWEEALGYTGLEMIAKGIPLIANPLGGVLEYAREGETAWLNPTCTGEGLAERMLALIREPGQVLAAHRRVVALRDELLIPWSEHVDAIDSVYREARTRSRAAA